MMNRKRWKHVIAAVMCATLVLSAPAVYAAEEKPSVQTEVKEEAQDTEQKKEEVKERTKELDEQEVLINKNEVSTSKEASNIDVKEESANEIVPASNESDFVIQDGVLKKYKGTESKVIVPDGVTVIGTGAFLDDSFSSGIKTIEEVILPEGVHSIEYKAFYGCSNLIKITFPTSINTIEEMAFDETKWLENQKLISPLLIAGSILFDGKAASGKVVVPEGVTSIGVGAFSSNTSITEVILPERVTAIGYQAFIGCTNLSAIQIPSSVNDIGAGAFVRTKWLEIKSQENPLVTINNILYKGESASGKIMIPDGVVKILPNAFSGSKNLEEITIPSSVQTVGEYAFNRCNNLKTVIIQEGVKGIGNYAFNGCKNLTKVVIPSSVTSIGEPSESILYGYYTIYGKEGSYAQQYAKRGNIPFEVVGEDNPTDPPKPDENGFAIKDGVLVKYTGTASEVTIPEGVTSIGERAFFQNKNITSLTIPSSLKSIGEFAFENCSNLGDLTIPSNVTYIGYGSFVYEGGVMRKLTINGNNTAIDAGAFAYRDIKEIVLSGSFTSIGEAAFDAQAMDSPIKSFTVNGVIENLGDIFPMTQVEKFIVNGDIKKIEGADNIFRASYSYKKDSYILTVYGKESSYIQKYAKDRNIPFEVIEGTPDEPSNPKHEVTLPSGNTSLSKSEMQNLLARNATDDIVIKTPSGVAFTFPKGSMKMIDGKESYDFGVELITDFSKVTNTPFDKDTFAFQINYNYDGELPGTANISIPVDSKWINQRLYYYQIMGKGDFKFLTSSVVDNKGIYTITQNHCSDYVATTQAPDGNGNPTKPSDTNTKTTPTNTNAKTSPKTGDTSAIWLYLALMMGAGVSVVIAKRKSKIK